MANLYSEIIPSVNLKPCPLSHRELQQQIKQSVPGQGKKYQHLRKQFLNGTISRRYGKYEADIVWNVKTDKKDYPSNQVKRHSKGPALCDRKGLADDRQNSQNKSCNQSGTNGGLDFEWKMSQLHEKYSK